MLKNIDIKSFREPINISLFNNLTKQTCSTLANILAIDYATRLDSKGLVSNHVDNCISKLKNFLKSQVITDSSFSTAMTLFTVAISPEDMNFQDKNNILNQEASQDVAIDAIIAMHFSEYSNEKQNQIKQILKSLLSNSSVKDLLNYLANEPLMIKNIVANALKVSTKQQEINNHALNEITRVFKKDMILNAKSNSFKQRVATITTGLATLAVVATCAVIGGIALPIIIIPAAVASLKFAPVIGEKLGKTILNYDNDFKQEKKNFQALKNQIIHAVIKVPTILKQQTKELPTRTISDISKVHSAELSAIKQELQEHKSEIETSSPIMAAAKRSKAGRGGVT